MVNPAIAVHFKRSDPKLYSLYTTIDLDDYRIVRPSDYFDSLCRQIIGQQLSGKVADVIYERFRKSFPGHRVTVSGLADITDESLRGIGMSWSKVRFLRDLAGKIEAKELNLSVLADATEAEVMETLTKVKGIGPWTVEMFLMFTLGRPDVFSYGDLGLRRAIQKLYGFKKEPSVRTMKRLAETWRPYRTIASRLLWAYLDADIRVVSGI